MKTIIKDALESINALTPADKKEIARYVNAKICSIVYICILDEDYKIINEFENPAGNNN